MAIGGLSDLRQAYLNELAAHGPEIAAETDKRPPGAARSMPTPLHLSDEEMDVLLGLAAPIAYGRRREFIEAVAAAVEQAGVGSGVGVGLVHRVAREVQGRSRRNAKRRSPPRRDT